MEVVDARAPDDQRVAGVIALLQVGGAIVERHGEGYRLDDGAQFEHAGRHPVDVVGLERICRTVRAEVGQRRQRQHLAGLGVEHDAGRRLGAELDHGLGELVRDGMLHPDVDRCLGRHRGSARRIGQRCGVQRTLVVEVFLQPGNAAGVEVHRAQHMCGKVAHRIDAPCLSPESDAGNAHVVNEFAFCRRYFALDPHEPALAVVELAAQVARVKLRQCAGQQFNRLVDIDHLGRVSVEGRYRNVGGKRMACPVRNVRPRDTHLELACSISLRTAAFDERQPACLAHQQRKAHREASNHQPQPLLAAQHRLTGGTVECRTRRAHCIIRKRSASGSSLAGVSSGAAAGAGGSDPVISSGRFIWSGSSGTMFRW